MKILQVIDTMSPISGGPCQGIRNSIPSLTALGCENEVVCVDAANADYLGSDPFIIHAIGPANNPWSYSKALLNWLNTNVLRFDAVIVHGLWLYHGYAVYLAILELKKRKHQVPKIYVMPHGMLDPYFQRDPSRRLKAIRNWFYWKLIEKRLIHEATAMLFTCEEELQLARESFAPYQPKSEINVGYGVPSPPGYVVSMKQAFLEKCPQLGEESYLLFLSRINTKKGVDLLIRAYVQLLTERSTAEASSQFDQSVPFPSLVIAGPLDSAYASEMQQLAAQLLPVQSSNTSQRVSPAIHFPGMLSGDAKWGAFYGCDAFVLPSHQENFGIAVVEALACGKPVLISDKVNIWREIKQAGGGTVNTDTFDGALKSLKSWIEKTPADREPFHQGALACFQKHYQITEAALQLQSVIFPNTIKDNSGNES